MISSSEKSMEESEYEQIGQPTQLFPLVFVKFPGFQNRS